MLRSSTAGLHPLPSTRSSPGGEPFPGSRARGCPRTGGAHTGGRKGCRSKGCNPGDLPDAPRPPPRLFAAAPAEPPEPGAEPGLRSLVPTERGTRSPARFGPEHACRSGSPAGSTRKLRSQELSPRRGAPSSFSSSSSSSQPVQPPGSTGSGRKGRREAGTAQAGVRLRPLPARARPQHALIGLWRHGPLRTTPPAPAEPAQAEKVPLAAGL